MALPHGIPTQRYQAMAIIDKAWCHCPHWHYTYGAAVDCVLKVESLYQRVRDSFGNQWSVASKRKQRQLEPRHYVTPEKCWEEKRGGGADEVAPLVNEVKELLK